MKPRVAIKIDIKRVAKTAKKFHHHRRHHHKKERNVDSNHTIYSVEVFFRVKVCKRTAHTCWLNSSFLQSVLNIYRQRTSNDMKVITNYLSYFENFFIQTCILCSACHHLCRTVRSATHLNVCASLFYQY